MKKKLIIVFGSLAGLFIIVYFIIWLLPFEESPCELEWMNLTVSPTEVTPNETVTIAVEVHSICHVEMEWELSLEINGIEEQTKYFALDADETKTVSFSVKKDIEDSYSITLGRLQGVFEVVTPEPVTVRATVTRVVDGDTIEVNLGGVIYKVRYIGIDTPETVHPTQPVECFGHEASAKNSELVAGKMVRLEKDVSETDKYGRLLRYVWVGDIFVNDYLVRQGYAYASTYPPDVKYADQFAQAQTEAVENNRGLWAICE